MGIKGKKILILAPHIDDAEWGCGGLMAQNIAEVRQLIFSSAEQSTLEAGYTITQLKEEHAEARYILTGSKYIVCYRCECDRPVRHFPAYRQGILEDMVALRKEYSPDIVILPGTGDVHQDHKVIHDEGIRAFKGHASILGYEIAHNYMEPFQANMYIKLTDEEMEKKIRAIECFKTQAHRAAYASPASIKALAVLRGSQIGVKYAEAYEVIRWVIK